MSTAAAMVSSPAEHELRKQGGDPKDPGGRETCRQAEELASNQQILQERLMQRGHYQEQW